MNKQFSTLETLRIMLDHKSVMFEAIRLMDKSGDRYINEAQFALCVQQHMTHFDGAEQQRLQVAFATDNMLQSHVLADKDAHDGSTRLIFQEAVIGLFRLCDSSLYQELTDSKLKSRLAGLWRVQERFVDGALSYSDEDPDYAELVDDTFEQLSMLLDVLKRNVVRMNRLSQDFEQMSNDACKDPDSFAQFREQLLVKVTTLFERHIKPTQKFLNHQIRLKEGDNLFAVLTSIEKCLEANDKQGQADQVFRFSLSFTSIFKPITVIAHQVDQFLRKTRLSMAQFNAMEHHFQKLCKAYDQTLERSLNKTKIDSAYAKSFDFINGLKRLPRPKDFRFSDSPSYYANLFAEIELRLADKLDKNEPFEHLEAWHNDEHKRKLERQLAVHEYVNNMSLRSCDDLTAAVHYRLSEAFDDYQFVDLLSAIIHLRQQARFEQNDEPLMLRTTNKKAFINYKDNIYIYRRKRLLPASHLVQRSSV